MQQGLNADINIGRDNIASPTMYTILLRRDLSEDETGSVESAGILAFKLLLHN